MTPSIFEIIDASGERLFGCIAVETDPDPPICQALLALSEGSVPAHISPFKFYPLCHSEAIKIHQTYRMVELRW